VYLIVNFFKSVVTPELKIERILPVEPPKDEQPVDYIYEQPRLTSEKRSRVRMLARRKTGRRTRSATPYPTTRPALYGTGLAGKRLKPQLARLAAEQAEAIYEAIVASRQGTPATTGTAGVPEGPQFDPTRPTLEAWERVLMHAATKLLGPPSPEPRPMVSSARRLPVRIFILLTRRNRISCCIAAPPQRIQSNNRDLVDII